jgi:hypothetical protein
LKQRYYDLFSDFASIIARKVRCILIAPDRTNNLTTVVKGLVHLSDANGADIGTLRLRSCIYI